MGWIGAALAGITGLLTGGIGAASQAKAQQQQNSQAQAAQAQETQLYQQALASNNAAQADMQSRITADTGALSAATASAQAAVGSPVSTKLRKFDGLGTVATSLYGDQSTPLGAKSRLLGN